LLEEERGSALILDLKDVRLVDEEAVKLLASPRIEPGRQSTTARGISVSGSKVKEKRKLFDFSVDLIQAGVSHGSQFLSLQNRFRERREQNREIAPQKSYSVIALEPREPGNEFIVRSAMSALATSYFREECSIDRRRDQIIGESPALKSVLERSNAWLRQMPQC
jgi:hypothetical protein